jgi:hypothetical protein
MQSLSYIKGQIEFAIHDGINTLVRSAKETLGKLRGHSVSFTPEQPAVVQNYVIANESYVEADPIEPEDAATEKAFEKAGAIAKALRTKALWDAQDRGYASLPEEDLPPALPPRNLSEVSFQFRLNMPARVVNPIVPAEQIKAARDKALAFTGDVAWAKAVQDAYNGIGAKNKAQEAKAARKELREAKQAVKELDAHLALAELDLALDAEDSGIDSVSISSQGSQIDGFTEEVLGSISSLNTIGK